MRIFILLFLVSCGEPGTDCRSQEEMRLRCKAEAVGRYAPGVTPEFEYQICDQSYPAPGCY